MCDPWGNRRVTGASLKKSQGDVEYLVEVCDPCQLQNYMINEIHMSDFVTPDYYRPHHSGGRYSFTRSVDRPLQVLDGGMVSWRTPNGQIWGQSGPDEAPERLKDATSLRGSIDPDTTAAGSDITDALHKPHRSRAPFYRLETSAGRYGANLKVSIDRILERMGVIPPKASIDAMIKLLTALSKPTDSDRTQFQEDPVGTLRDYGLDPPADPQILKNLKLADANAYKAILATIKGGSGFGDPELLDWLSTHGVLVHAGIE
jgi:hypothetical protein